MEIVIVRGKTNGKRLSEVYLYVCRSLGWLVGWLVGLSVIISKTGGKLQFRASTRALVWLAVTFFTIIWKVHGDYYSITIWSFLAIMIHNTYPRRERFLKHFYLVEGSTWSEIGCQPHVLYAFSKNMFISWEGFRVLHENYIF